MQNLKKMTKTFIVQRHSNFGILGFLEKGAPPQFEPLAGAGTAHDCLEHFPGDDGSIDHEFMALGCCLWIRGVGGYPFNNGDGPSNTATDISEQLWGLYLQEDYVMRPPAGKIRINEHVEETLRHGRKNILSLEEDDYKIDRDALQTFLNSAQYWLQIGFNRAKRRYPKPSQVCWVFQQIEEEVNRALKFAEECYEYEIQYCIKKSSVNLKQKPFAYDDYYY